ncbi:hypothetical protein GOP47_0016833 [Adiantum capillus-veneris]|uniref:Uncharacterized protein n=1 Tax=Adiantum capillus-veneris TaxID=13818 RepID=A0A9D4UIF5_ADICA|nr:hypothetical protein GOP47_0016833 [Adiantum capillus-veneris]
MKGHETERKETTKSEERAGAAEEKKEKKKETQRAQGNEHKAHELGAEKPGDLHVSDEDDMLFNFNMQPGVSTIDQRKASGIKDGVQFNDGKESTHLSDEDDMLFNFNMQPGVSTIDQSKASGNNYRQDKKTKVVLVEDEKSALVRPLEGIHEMLDTDENFTKREKKKKKKKETQRAQGNELTCSDDSYLHAAHELGAEKPGDLHEPSVLDGGRKGTKKTKKKYNDNVVWQDRVQFNDEKNSVHVSDEDDMLFNFNMQPGVSTIDQRKVSGINHRQGKKTKVVLVEDEKSALVRPLEGKHEMLDTDESLTKREKKKKKKKETQRAQGNEPTRSDDGYLHMAHQLGAEKPGDLHETSELDGGRKGKKKTKKKNNDDGVCQDGVHLNDGKNSAHISDEDDMLFNFNMQPGVSTIDQRKASGINHIQDKKTKVVLVEDEKLALVRPLEGQHEMLDTDENLTKREKKKKKRRKGEEGQDLLYIDYKDANGSTGQSKKLQYDTSTDKQQLKEPNKIVKPDVADVPQNNHSPFILSSRPTFSMAVAGSIVDNAQSLKLATMLAGQIARAAAIFRVDEIVVFDDYDGENASNYMQETESEEVGGLFMVKILKYLEVPQYLRKALIPMQWCLSSAGKLPPLDVPHHLRKHEWRPFREGVILDKRPSSSSGSCVDVGLDKEVLVRQSLRPGTRVTVAMGQSKADGDVLQVVDREAARKAGFYWGYTVRYANCLSAVFDECPFEGKYDFLIGTSEHGEKIRSTDLVIPKCKHLLVAFGGLSGLEESLELDRKLKNRAITSVFHRYLNTCPEQGSRTIRTEEAILISLQTRCVPAGCILQMKAVSASRF